MNFVKIFTVFFFVLLCSDIHGQADKNYIKDIQILFDQLYFAENDIKKEEVNRKIITEFEEYLNSNSFTAAGSEEIKNLYTSVSEDDNVTVFTWAVPYSDNTVKYFGFIRYYSKNSRKYYVDQLIQKTNFTVNDYENVNINEWYGAVYYKMISKKFKGETQYILLGWDACDLLTNKKIIDIIKIEEGEYPVFGKDVFETDNGLKKRVIFEYAERVTMTLKYDKKLKMIIWDHLSPSKPELEGHYEYYGPDMTFDGFRFENGIWKIVKDIPLN